MNKECLLYSSGIDSFIAKYYLEDNHHEFDCLYFDHGGRYCNYEIEKIKNLSFDVKISKNLQLGDIEKEDAFIPNRNLLMTTMAHSLGYEKIWLGGSLSDRIGDNKSEVCNKLSSLLTDVNESYCKIDSPFYGCYKEDMVKWFVLHHPTFRIDLLKNTFSCFHPLEKSETRNFFFQNNRYEYNTNECLSCPACFRKLAVLLTADIFVEFKSDENQTIIMKYLDEFKFPLVKTPRSEGTLNYISKWMLKQI